jgi:hypothetical protein
VRASTGTAGGAARAFEGWLGLAAEIERTLREDRAVD